MAGAMRLSTIIRVSCGFVVGFCVAETYHYVSQHGLSLLNVTGELPKIENWDLVLRAVEQELDTEDEGSDAVLAPYPHCDSLVLHAPGKYVYCDHYPTRQWLREAEKINFTGERDSSKQPCPSEIRRPLEVINRWHGNVAMTPELLKKQDEYYEHLRQTLEKE